MHLQQVSEIFFDETIAMSARTETARSSGAAATAGQDFLGLLEPLCRHGMQRCLDAGEALSAVPELRVELSGAAGGDRLRLGGWVEQISERSATFRVRAQAAGGIAFEATLRFDVVADPARTTPPHRLATPAPRSAVAQRGLALAAG